jgi:hypothetical protein
MKPERYGTHGVTFHIFGLPPSVIRLSAHGVEFLTINGREPTAGHRIYVIRKLLRLSVLHRHRYKSSPNADEYRL